jgi:hypothetical protein
MTPAAQLAMFMARYSPDVVHTAKGALSALRKRFAGTQELVYDNYNALVVAWSPTGRVSEVICSIALYPRWVNLFFMQGAKLKDPTKRLRGTAKIKNVILESAKTLDEPAVRALLASALDVAIVAPRGTAKPVTIIKSISAKQRPRKPAAEPDRSKTRRAPARSTRTRTTGRARASR